MLNQMGSATHSIIKQIQAGDRAGFDALVSAHAEEVLRLAFFLLQDAEEARDIFQEALLRLIRCVKEGKFRKSNGSIKGFLKTTARNLCINRLRQTKRLQFVDPSGRELNNRRAETNNPAAAMQLKQFERQFYDALDQLPVLQRTILVLHEVNEESISEIGRALDMQDNAVRTNLWRARKKLRQILAPYAEDL